MEGMGHIPGHLARRLKEITGGEYWGDIVTYGQHAKQTGFHVS